MFFPDRAGVEESTGNFHGLLLIKHLYAFRRLPGRVFPDRPGGEGVMIARDYKHGDIRSSQNISRLLHQNAVHTVILECISGNEDELCRMGLGSLNNPPGSEKALLTEARSNSANVCSLHPKLPVRRVKKFHRFTSSQAIV